MAGGLDNFERHGPLNPSAVLACCADPGLTGGLAKHGNVGHDS